MEFYPVLPADASPGAGGMDAPGVMPGIVAVRPADLRRPGRGGVSALVTVPPGGRPLASGEELVFCHQVTVSPAVVRRSGEVQAAAGRPITSPSACWRRTCRTGRSRSWPGISAARRNGSGCCRP